MNNTYTINKKTLAIIPISERSSKIYEENNVIIVPKTTQKLIEENCIYYGSSYSGRKKGTVDLIGVTHKSPIVIEETNGIIFFPTSSPRLKTCGWIALNNVSDYKEDNKDTIISFENDLQIKIPVSNKIINNQILRATRLESLMYRRKKIINNQK